MTGTVQKGGCRCGRVRFEVEGAPLLTTACHCTGCQHMTASAFSLSSGYPASAFLVTQGETVKGGIQGENHHAHCEFCKSWLFTRSAAMGDIVNVRTTMLDAVPADPPFMETYRAEGLPWVETGAVRSFEALPEMNEWPRLIAEYAQHVEAGSRRQDGDAQ